MNYAETKSLLADHQWNYWFTGFCDGEASFTFRLEQKSRRARPRFKLCLQQDSALIQEVFSLFAFGSAPGEFTPRALRNGIAYAPRAEWDVNAVSSCIQLVEFFHAYPLRSHKRQDFLIWAELVAEAASPRPDRTRLNTIAMRLSQTRCSGHSRTAQATLRQWLPCDERGCEL